MKYIIVIKGVMYQEYQQIREDLIIQIKSIGWQVPLFCHLPSDYADIKVVWLNEDIEKAMFAQALQEEEKSQYENRTTL